MEISIEQHNHKFPYSIVWTKLPCISCILPCIGHVGICKSDGTIFDFLGPEIHSGQLGFGSPMKYVYLYDKSIDPKKWDFSIEEASLQFSKKNHNLFTNNCHHHVARVLNMYQYKNRDDWTAFKVWKLTLTAKMIEYPQTLYSSGSKI